MLTERLQRAAIWDLARNGTRSTEFSQFDEPWSKIYGQLLLLLDEKFAETPEVDDPLEWAISSAGVVLSSASDYWDQVDEIYMRIRSAAREYRPPTLDVIAASYPPVSWLWPGWIPNGMVSLLAGKPGTGKSHWALDLVRIVMDGASWPDGQDAPSPGSVLWIEGEGIAQEINDRGLAMGIDTSQIYITTAPDGEILNLLESAWQDQVVNAISVVNPKLIVVDSLSTITDKGQDRTEQVTPLLIWLAGLARWSGAAMLVIHHLRKGSNGQASLPLMTLDDVRGSGQIGAQMRAVLGMVVASEDPDGPRRLDVLKKTISRLKTPKPLLVTAVREGDVIARFDYGEAERKATNPRVECADWMQAMLEEFGPLSARQLVRDGEEEGYSRATILRAREQLESEGIIEPTKGARVTGNKWRLAESQESQESQESHDDPPSDA